MNKLLLTILTLTIIGSSCFLGYTEGLGDNEATKTALREAEEKVVTVTKDVQGSMDLVKAANERIERMAIWYNDCVSIANGLTDVIWDLTAEQIKDITSTISKPPYQIGLEVPQPIKVNDYETYNPTPLFY